MTLNQKSLETQNSNRFLKTNICDQKNFVRFVKGHVEKSSIDSLLGINYLRGTNK